MKRVRVGVVGYGYWGPNLIRNLANLPTVDLVAVADLSEERLVKVKELYPEIAGTKDYTDFFAMDLDAVVVATPPSTHYPLAKTFIQHGLHVMTEKPLTLNTGNAEELVQLANEENKVLMVGHVFEFNAAVKTLKQVIESGELGDVYYIDSARLNLGLYQFDLSVLWDLAPHDVSILMYLLGQYPTSVSAQGRACVVTGVHDVVHMELSFPGNVLAHVHVSWLEPAKIRRMTVVGSKKMAVYNDIEPREKVKIFDKGVDISDITKGKTNCQYRNGEIQVPDIKFTEPLKEECQHFINCVMTNEKPLTDGMDGLRVVKVLEAANSSLCNSSHQEVLQW